jgi:dihydrodipicolinate synthase/N-acetylneuraminate lyase
VWFHVDRIIFGNPPAFHLPIFQLTCAGIGKGHRIAAHTQSKTYLSHHGPFQILPGFSDYLLPALTARHTGCITGTGNVFPKLIVKLYDTSVKALATGDAETMKEALALQDKGG